MVEEFEDYSTIIYCGERYHCFESDDNLIQFCKLDIMGLRDETEDEIATVSGYFVCGREISEQPASILKKCYDYSDELQSAFLALSEHNYNIQSNIFHINSFGYKTKYYYKDARYGEYREYIARLLSNLSYFISQTYNIFPDLITVYLVIHTAQIWDETYETTDRDKLMWQLFLEAGFNMIEGSHLLCYSNSD